MKKRTQIKWHTAKLVDIAESRYSAYLIQRINYNPGAAALRTPLLSVKGELVRMMAGAVC